ncbi:MAG: ATP-dependent protease LonB [Methanomassiliicoccaceae archaeon]|jgi:Lon-like ATP-dependent protease|nr:ATP-dependent protease LonB [Euryarchaeota archaeon]HOB37834.1 ATP-dependent protease LonB [Methanomassiliicoccaceae archaeon]HOQ25204.1 ATP-dependent protease LonB [Methanomassiliicoccaceae archaeon]HQA20302.1 ATP-dependent protease LonB [Methanomassiliicoccaceae archaeon]HQD87331.1 ATP-dependent protease LonB [Methanomassiliicoccaceae archaeon]
MSSEVKPSEIANPDIDAWIESRDFETTADIKIPEKLADQVIGQDAAVEVIKKAAEQKRHVMLIGEPGTGKSMLSKSMTEFLPKGELQDIIAYHNPEDPNEPKVRIVPAGKGKEIVAAQKKEAMAKKQQKASIITTVIVLLLMMTVAMFLVTQDISIILVGIIAVAILFFATRYSATGKQESYLVPKLLVGHDEGDMPPFVDATGAHAGALLGDVKHDPFQSGGLETPAHERLEVGAIHKASKGVLFIDEINMLRMESQQSLLTALQEGKFPITGQSERSSGAMVKSEPVPCDFVLVCAGNLDAIQGMHPALRSRIRGYGYEVFMRSTMEDTDANRDKLVRFVAQEVARDKKIPHFDKHAVGEIIKEAQRRAGRHGLLTLRLRELGGLVRVAGDIAREKQQPLVTAEMVREAKRIARSLEQQIADRYLESSREYQTFRTVGESVGTVNGLAALNSGSSMAEYSGIVLPIVAEVTPAQTRSGGRIIATGKLGEIAKEAVQNVSALVKKYTGEDIANHDVHIQFVGTYEGVEGDSASISVATAVISAFEDVPVDQNLAMTGSLSVRGQVLPVGGVTAKIEAACDAGIKRVLIPRANLRDVVLDKQYVGKIDIIPVDTLGEVLEKALIGGPKKDTLLRKLSDLVERKVSIGVPAPGRPAAQ